LPISFIIKLEQFIRQIPEHARDGEMVQKDNRSQDVSVLLRKLGIGQNQRKALESPMQRIEQNGKVYSYLLSIRRNRIPADRSVAIWPTTFALEEAL
jgi:hypothetical protein